MKGILGNPFHVLGASTRSTKAEIAELAEHAELVHDHGKVVAARGELVNSRTRLAAEIAWLPGASPSKIKQVIQAIGAPDSAINADLGLSPIAAANVFSTALQLLKDKSPVAVQRGCEALSSSFDRVDPDEVIRDINEDRTIAGFPVLNDIAPVEEGISGQRRLYVQAMVDALDGLRTSDLVSVVTELIEESTEQGAGPAAMLISDLVEVFERKVSGFLETEAADIESLIDGAEARAREGANSVEISALTTRILERTEKWDQKAQPVQVLMQSRGLQHDISVRLALSLRGLAIELFNEHDYLAVSKRISERLRQIFSEVPEVAERVEEDIEALTDIAEARKNAAAKSKTEKAQFAASIAYETTFGLLFKDLFRLSVDGVTWNNDHLPLESVQGISWGGLRGQYQTTFDIRFYGPRGTIAIQFSDESKFDDITDRVWKAVGVRLLIEMLDALKRGVVLNFSGVRISDKGVVLPVDRMFRAASEVFVPWKEARKVMRNGCLVITSNDGKATGSIDMRQVRNAPVISTALDIYWKKGGETLSSILGT